MKNLRHWPKSFKVNSFQKNITLGCILSVCFFVPRSGAQTPAINQLSPSSGAAGTSLTINGNNFGATASENIVYFGPVRAQVAQASTTSLLVNVPSGTAYRQVSVTSNALTAFSPESFGLTFSGSQVLTASSFAPHSTFGINDRGYNLGSADFDGDGKTDLVVTNISQETFSILRNTGFVGNISFASKIDLKTPTKNYEMCLATGDMDGDGKIDIILASSLLKQFFIYRNTSQVGNIAFEEPVAFDLPTDLLGMSVADMDVDGKLDVIIFNSQKVVVSKNLGSPAAFSFSPGYEVADGQALNSVNARDLNSDGKPDIIITDNNTKIVKLYLNTTGTGLMSFYYARILEFGEYLSKVYIADFDEDGKPDIAISYRDKPSVAILKNSSEDSDLSFLPKNDIVFPRKPISIAVENLNGDAKPDLIVGTSMAGATGPFYLSILQNNTSGNAISFMQSMEYSNGREPIEITAADFDNDGKADIATINQQMLALSVIRNRHNEPVISSFTPAGGPAKTVIGIKGINFTNATKVLVGDTAAASFVIQSDSSIEAVVGNGASGTVSVETPFGKGSLPGYTFGAAPNLTSFEPDSARSGTYITIKGKNISGAKAVSFGLVPSPYFYNTSDTSLQAMVGQGASGKVSVTTVTGTGSLAGFIFLPPPEIISFSPVSAFSGDEIKITGRYFNGITSVSFGDIPAASFTLLSDTLISAKTGSGATGALSMSSPLGTSSLEGFTYLGPNVSSFTPAYGGPETIVEIEGTNFNGVTSVAFGGTPAASFTVASVNHIAAKVGTGASGNVTVTSAQGTGTKAGFLMPPFISNISPAKGPAGTSVTISGNSFGKTTNENSVYFGGTKATVTASSTTSLTVTVPSGGTSGQVSVTVKNLTGYSPIPFMITFNGSPFVASSFALGTDLIPLGSCDDIRLADFNSDGKQDIVVAKNGSGISVFKNKSVAGSTLFDTAISYGKYIFDNSSKIAVADFDGDGLTDIAEANYLTDEVVLYRNYSYGNRLSFFSSKFLTTDYPSSIASGDIDGDGKPDIVVTSYRSSTLSIFRNTSSNGNIAFGPRQDYPLGYHPYMVTLTDLDNDRKAEIPVLHEYGDSAVTIFRNMGVNSTITLEAATSLRTNGNSGFLTAGDLNGDGYNDLAVNDGFGFVSIYQNTGTGIALEKKADQITGFGSRSISVGDLNGDGKADISVAISNKSSIGIIENTSSTENIGFKKMVEYPVSLEGFYNAPIITGDIDGDGKPDLVVPGYPGLQLHRNIINQPPVITSFTPAEAMPGDTITINGAQLTGTTAVSFGNTPANMFKVLTDKLVIALVGPGTAGNISVTTDYGTAFKEGFLYFSPPEILSFVPLKAMVGASLIIKGKHFSRTPSLNKVNFGTIAATVTNATDSSITVTVPSGAAQQHIFVNSNGRIAISTQIFSTLFSGGGISFDKNSFDSAIYIPTPYAHSGSFAVGDIDGDGRNDLHANGYGYNNIESYTLYQNSSITPVLYFGSGTVIEQDKTYIAAEPVLTFCDSDDKPDIVLEKEILRNNSLAGHLSLTEDTFKLYSPASFYISKASDFDGDGRIDIAVVGYNPRRLVVIKNSSVGNAISYSPGMLISDSVGVVGDQSYNRQLFTEDFNGDGRPDIAVVAGYEIAVFRNSGALGSIAFDRKKTVYYPVNVGAENAAVADFNNDGKVDIATSSANSGKVGIWINNSKDGEISFAEPFIINFDSAAAIAAADFDGDGKVDICVNKRYSNTVAIIKNASESGNIAFSDRQDYVGAGEIFVTAEDLDNDGKPEIITANRNFPKSVIGILRNAIGEPIPLLLCPPLSSATVVSKTMGGSYKWQLDSGGGFANILDGPTYTNSNARTLLINHMGSSSSGHRLRCLIDGNAGEVYTIKFTNAWLGSKNNFWEVPENWKCGSLPDENTEVVISSGTVIINSDVTVKSLRVAPGATVTVSAGFKLNIKE